MNIYFIEKLIFFTNILITPHLYHFHYLLTYGLISLSTQILPHPRLRNVPQEMMWNNHCLKKYSKPVRTEHHHFSMIYGYLYHANFNHG